MNSGLSTVDIGLFVVDEHSFLGQTLKLGIEYNLLPENAEVALRMYLQTHTMIFGQKNRTGIALGREELEQGVFQATLCLELGLMDQAEGDANRAAEIVATGDFESIRKRGWEIAFFRLEEMREEAQLFPQRRESGFLADYTDQIRRWSFTAPETWVCTDPEDEDGPTIVDPMVEYLPYQDLVLKIELLKSLPSDTLKMYGSAVGGRSMFSDLLRNLILSLSLGLDSLVPKVDHVVAFGELIKEEQLAAEIADTVLAQLKSQIGADVNESARDRFLSEVRDEVHDLVVMSADMLKEHFVTRG